MARPIPPLPPETVNSTSYARPAFGRGVRADGPARRGLIRATWERSVSIQTDDFVTFRITTLNGPAAQNKGMVLFPRRIDGRYVMLSRRDRENLHLATSTDVRHWSDVTELHRPSRPWELLQIGNCGSPVETEAGWLVITHGVGPMRCYVLGALLLDLEDPRRVLGYLREPLLAPKGVEREGYVPNVVYSCGGIKNGNDIILPYGLSDAAVGIAIISIPELLATLRVPPS